MINKLLLLILLLVGISSCGSGTKSSDGDKGATEAKSEKAPRVQFIESQEARALMEQRDGIILLDVRTQKEYDAGHVKDALHVDFHSPKFSQHLLALDPDKTYIVYCAVGGRSKKAVDIMEEMGFKQLYEVSEGYSGLKKAGIPVVE